MKLLEETLAAIAPPDAGVMAKVQARLDSLTKPPGSLGRLEDIVRQYAGVTGEERPAIPRKCMVLAAADHGVARLGLSAYPIETTIHMTRNYLVSRGAGANALAKFSGADLVVVDVGIAGDMSDVPGLWHRKIAYGTADFTQGPAMTGDQAVAALEAGIEIVADRVGKGYRCFSIGEMGIGNTTSSAAIVAAFTGITPEQATGRGTGISDSRLATKIDAVRKGLAVNKPDPTDGLDVLAKVGGFEIGALAGAILGAAAKRCLVVIDGFNASAAALIATSLSPVAREYLLASHLSAEPAHTKMLERLGLEAYIDMGLRLGEATGASLAMDLLDAAIMMLAGMATFAEAGVCGDSREVCKSC
ncbi:nicotinate-nucleotide--dimethylbenzimidazole phosphoribosyltransferase [Anaeroselena agilis]|uniref:Nicotinate-nucleotide--dimethylbenzimidazole phosphoribosyltransferase n=1 Tax=Anaeroselena agilis TaxID=3063788 RepID=A0ABU3NUF9_9FIRM|nr:nicotinate-nucleotide--dimethylbenzimidazole phosphoribosyltransferase [Selenomonadales bacterium 4137-cl]